MLGVTYGTVRLVEHDSRWAAAFAAEHAVLAAALDGFECTVEHIGSTSVPDLPAKPILDIAVGIPEPRDVAGCIPRLEGCGYEYRGDAGADGGHVFVRASGTVRTHHVHLVERGGDQWKAYLALRDLLRGDEAARRRYAAAKHELASRFPHDRKRYTDAKNAVVSELLNQAMEGA